MEEEGDTELARALQFAQAKAGAPVVTDAGAPVVTPAKNDEHPQPAWLLLRGTDAAPTRPVTRPSRVVMLHGWLQEHGSWLRTALALRDTYGHDVLLLDFYGHGASPAVSIDLMTPEALARMVSVRVAALGWDRGAPIALAGASLGAAVAMRYARDHPGRVVRLTLVAPAGLPEPWWHPTRYAGRFAGALLAAAPTFITEGWLKGKLHLVPHTPTYGMAEGEVVALARCARHPPAQRTLGRNLDFSPIETHSSRSLLQVAR